MGKAAGRRSIFCVLRELIQTSFFHKILQITLTGMGREG
jgi:hypothetical protein